MRRAVVAWSDNPCKMVYVSPQTLEYPKDATLTDILLEFNFNQTPPEKPAIIDGPSGVTVFTYDGFRTGVKKVANHLHHNFSLRPGTVIAILSFTNVRLSLFQSNNTRC
jgi:4-coumarate--CoA ligase